jgi:hypothetical protein
MAKSYLTAEDAQTYGHEVIGLTQRAALTAVSPVLDQLAAQNNKLQRQLAKEQRRQMDQAVEAAVPNFREIDKNPRFHKWLLGIDILTGRVRQTLLNDAIAKFSAPRAIEFFRRFLQEEGGVAQTYSNTNQRSYSRPVYSRESIKELYERRRKGEFDEATWNRVEADIFAAQKDGRLQMQPYLTK